MWVENKRRDYRIAISCSSRKMPDCCQLRSLQRIPLNADLERGKCFDLLGNGSGNESYQIVVSLPIGGFLLLSRREHLRARKITKPAMQQLGKLTEIPKTGHFTLVPSINAEADINGTCEWGE